MNNTIVPTDVTMTDELDQEERIVGCGRTHLREGHRNHAGDLHGLGHRHRRRPQRPRPLQRRRPRPGPRHPQGDGRPRRCPHQSEELFAAGYAACFHNALKSVARAKKITLTDTAITVDVGIGPADGGVGYQLTVAIEADIPGVDGATARDLLDAAHGRCPYSRATRDNIDVRLTLA